jgi:hypothetical protein
MEVLTKSEMVELLYIADGTLGRKNKRVDTHRLIV